MKVYPVFYNDGEGNAELVRIFKTEKDAKLFTIMANFLDDCVFSASGYHYDRWNLEELKPNEEDWKDFIEAIKYQIKEYGDEERIKELLREIIDLIPKKYKKQILVELI